MQENQLIQRQTSLSANVVAFCRFLRFKDFFVGIQDEQTVLQALAWVNLENREIFKLTLKSVLVKKYAQIEKFEQLYQTYWTELEKAIDSKIAQGEPEPSAKPPQKAGFQALKDWLYGNNQAQEEAELAVFSPGEVFAEKEFSIFTQADLKEFKKWVNDFVRKLANRLHRRKRKTLKNKQLDLRRTLRLNLRRGGEIIDLTFKHRQIHPPKLVILCDVSKSMDLYSQFLIQFLYAFQTAYTRLETFIFSSSLQKITELLDNQNISETLKKISQVVPQWSGGTRIGESLHTFVENYGLKYLDSKTTVIILSDGWDTGDTDLLADSIQKIKKKSGYLIWLNPLAGSPDYQPITSGMQTVMPYIDVFAPAHNLASLQNLLKYLKI